ncbi:MAG: MFS transporter [Clostridia bacterium]|nr:MFS transporter [Clostridia bacterium]
MKKICIFIAVMALLFVIIQMDQPHYFPTREITLNRSNTLDIEKSEKGIVVVNSRRILFATPEGELKRIREGNRSNPASEARIIETDGRYIYAVILEIFPDADFISAEKVGKYTFDGEYLGELYRKEYARSACMDINTFKDIRVVSDEVFITELDDNAFSLVSVSADPAVTGDGTTLFTRKEPERLQHGEYQPDENRMILYNVYNEAYYYDIQEDTLNYHPEVANKQFFIDNPDITLSISGYQIMVDVLYYIALAVVIMAVCAVLIGLGRSGFLMNYRTAIIFVILFAFAVGYYTKMKIEDYEAGIEDKIRYTEGPVSVGVEYFMKEGLNHHVITGAEDFSDPEVRARLSWLRSYISEVTKTMGYDMALYIQLYLLGDDNELYLAVDSYNEYPVGTRYQDVTGETTFRMDDSDRYDIFRVEDEADGSYALMRHTLYDANGNKKGFLEFGSEYGKLRSVIISDTVEISLQLLAFVLFLYVAFDIVHKYRGEIHSFIRLRKTDPDEARISLSNTYDYIVSFLMYIDSLIMVLVVAKVTEASSMNIAIAFAIPFTAYRIGSSCGSIITSTFIGFFGERKSGILSSVIAALSFVGIAFCIETKNIYLFSALKFVEGIFLESILFSIAEGVPYEIEDETKRNKKILESQSATSAARLTGLMIGGIIANYIGYSAMYVFCGLLAAVLIPMSMMILRKGSEQSAQSNTLEVWKFFLRPRPLSYIIFVVFSISLLYGYEEFVFPLVSENSGLSELMLSSIGVLTCSASYFGEGILKLFRKRTPFRAMVYAFTVCGISLLVALIKPTILIAVLVLLSVCVFERVIDNYKIVSLIELNGNTQIDNKGIQENYYALEDTFRTLHGPLLGGLSAISTGVALGFMATINLILPRIYSFIHRKKA